MPALLSLARAVLLSFFGLALVVVALFSAVKTFVLPRSAPDPVVRVVFRGLRRVFEVFTRQARTYAQRDAIMAFFAPIGLLALAAITMAPYALGSSDRRPVQARSPLDLMRSPDANRNARTLPS